MSVGTPPPGGAGGEWTERLVRQELHLAFARLHKMAFGIAVGTVTGLSVGVVTVLGIVLGPEETAHLALLSHYFAGYEVSWSGALVGALWGAGVGAVAGWFVAFVRNFVLAAWLLIARSRAELEATRDFLDHI